MMRDFRYAVRMLIKTPGFYDHRHPRGGARHRRIDDDVLGDQRAPPASDAVDAGSGSAALRQPVLHQTAGPGRGRGVPRLPRVEKAGDHFGRNRRGRRNATFIVSGGDKPERYLGARISADAFTFLGVQPILGRQFRAEEDQLNAPPVALHRLRHLEESFRR